MELAEDLTGDLLWAMKPSEAEEEKEEEEGEGRKLGKTDRKEERERMGEGGKRHLLRRRTSTSLKTIPRLHLQSVRERIDHVLLLSGIGMDGAPIWAINETTNATHAHRRREGGKLIFEPAKTCFFFPGVK